MRRINLSLCLIWVCATLFFSCQKSPFIRINGEHSIEFSELGGSQGVGFSCNRNWTITSSESWLHFSSSSGDANGSVSILITCDANTTYDVRTARISISVEGISEFVVVSQNANSGFFVSSDTCEIDGIDQLIEIEISTNVPYEISTDQPWIKHVLTKGLSTSKVTFSIDENLAFQGREGHIFFRRTDGTTILSVLVKQAEGMILFSDSSFKAYIVKYYDTNNDGEISCKEALSVNKIRYVDKGISQIDCLYYFKNLTELYLDYNYLVSIDVSCFKDLQYFSCSNNQLTIDLILCENPQLRELNCSGNQIKSLDVGNCSSLQKIVANSNYMLTTLNIKGCTSLQELIINNAKLESIDASDCVALQKLVCNSNSLSYLNVSNCVSLQHLDCLANALTELDLSECHNLQTVNCCYNGLKSLDVSAATSLTSLAISSNKDLASLVLGEGKTLAELWCGETLLSSLDLKGCVSLQKLYCYRCQLASLDVSTCEALEDFECNDNMLTSLNVSGLSSLKRIMCFNNQLEEITVSDCISLIGFSCANNFLKTLDVSNCLDLNFLECVGNPTLKEIWLKNGQSIPYFYYNRDVATIKYKD